MLERVVELLAFHIGWDAAWEPCLRRTLLAKRPAMCNNARWSSLQACLLDAKTAFLVLSQVQTARLVKCGKAWSGWLTEHSVRSTVEANKLRRNWAQLGPINRCRFGCVSCHQAKSVCERGGRTKQLLDVIGGRSLGGTGNRVRVGVGPERMPVLRKGQTEC